jgi:hypothetical protein
MKETKVKPAVKFGLFGLIIAFLVVWGGGAVSGTDLLGSGSPKFGPVNASSILIVIIGIVGAIIGAYRRSDKRT